MIVSFEDNKITIILNPDEKETLDYVNSISTGLLQTHLENFFNNRKRQEEEDLRLALTKSMDRARLKSELRKVNNG